MSHVINDADLDTLFRGARSHSKWLDKPVTPQILLALYDLLRWGPTSANCSPARFVFCASRAAKERLAKHMSKPNAEKSLTAPVCAIVAFDLDFAERLPQLFKAADAKSWFAEPKFAEVTAFRNATLQGGYFIMAARAVGLDCGPMSGFDNDGVDKDFFVGTQLRSNFLCALGYGDANALPARDVRLSFDEACKIL